MARWRKTRGRRPARLRALCAPTSLAVVLIAAGSASAEPRLEFARHGEEVATRGLAELSAGVDSSEVRVHEPYEEEEALFDALPFEQVLDAVYSEAWRSEEEIVFTCADGYRPTVPVSRVLSHRAWLAFGRADQDAFTIRKRESGEVKNVELGPFYLIWENLDDPKIRQESDYGWPYQLVAIDLRRRADLLPALNPPEGASPDVLAGFEAFRIHCSKCHELNGEGGSIGPALSAAANPLQYRDADWLRTWIEEPSRIRPNTRMEALNPQLPDRDAVVDDILAYLRVMLAPGREPATPGTGG